MCVILSREHCYCSCKAKKGSLNWFSSVLRTSLTKEWKWNGWSIWVHPSGQPCCFNVLLLFWPLLKSWENYLQDLYATCGSGIQDSSQHKFNRMCFHRPYFPNCCNSICCRPWEIAPPLGVRCWAWPWAPAGIGSSQRTGLLPTCLLLARVIQGFSFSPWLAAVGVGETW